MPRIPMKPSTAPSTPGQGPDRVSAVLGPDHPLARSSEMLTCAFRQSHVVAAMLFGSVIAAIRGARWAPALAIAAAIVLLSLALIVTGLLRAERTSARGVALAERLVTDGGSPLYGHDAAALRNKLQIIGRLLST